MVVNYGVNLRTIANENRRPLKQKNDTSMKAFEANGASNEKLLVIASSLGKSFRFGSKYLDSICTQIVYFL